MQNSIFLWQDHSEFDEVNHQVGTWRWQAGLISLRVSIVTTLEWTATCREIWWYTRQLLRYMTHGFTQSIFTIWFQRARNCSWTLKLLRLQLQHTELEHLLLDRHLKMHAANSGRSSKRSWQIPVLCCRDKCDKMRWIGFGNLHPKRRSLTKRALHLWISVVTILCSLLINSQHTARTAFRNVTGADKKLLFIMFLRSSGFTCELVEFANND